MASRTPTPSGGKSGKMTRPADAPTTPLPIESTPLPPPVDQIVVKPKAMPEFEDLGDLSELGVMESATISALVSAAVGDEDDDDDVLGLNKPRESTSGPPSGFMRPPTAPEDDAVSLDMIATAPGADAPLSFVARSDIRRTEAEADDIITTSTMKQPGSTLPAWLTPPKSGNIKPTLTPQSGKMIKSPGPKSNRTPKPAEKKNEANDIFGDQSGTARTGDSNLLSFLAGPKGESSNILGGNVPSSDLFGDSRIVSNDTPPNARASSDILAGSRASSDILAGSGVNSDILAGIGDEARGSSLFDESGRRTDKLPETAGEASITSPDQFVPLFDEPIEGSAIVLNRPAGKGPKLSPDPIDDDPGRISFDIPKSKKKTSNTDLNSLEDEDEEENSGEKTNFTAVPEDEEDAMAAEFLGGGDRSGVNLLGQFEHQDTMSESEEDESSDLFAGPTIMELDLDGASGVNLLDPTAGSVVAGRNSRNPKSEHSIFSGPNSSARIPSASVAASSLSNHEQPPSMVAGPDTNGPSSAIFPPTKNRKLLGSTDAGSVSFDLPNRAVSPEQTDRIQTSGMIDWSKSNTDSGQISQRTQRTDQMSLSGEVRQSVNADLQHTDEIESDSVFDVHLPEDASTESQLMKAEAYAKAAAAGAAVAESGIIAGRSGKIPKVEPISSRTKFVPPPPVKRGSLGWIGGTAAGLLAGVGISAGAYLAGVIPNKADASLEIAAVKRDSEAQIMKANSDAAALTEKTKQDADAAIQKLKQAELSLKETKGTITDLQSRAKSADLTAKAANEAKLAAERLAKTATADAMTANQKVADARNEAMKAQAEREEIANKVAMIEMAVRLKTEEVSKANEKVATAEKNVTSVKAMLADVAKQLQTAGLIDAKSDSNTAIAAIPTAIKKAAAAGSTPDGVKLKELAEKLVTAESSALFARKQAEETKANADSALAKAKQEQQSIQQKYESDLKTVKAGMAGELEKAVAVAVKNVETKLQSRETELRNVQDQLAKENQKYETRLAAQAEEFRQQITAVRAGMIVTATDSERSAAERAARLFGVGADAYFDGRFTDAVTALDEATKANPADARAWYYLGLSRWSSGDRNAAIEAFKSGGQWEARSATAARQVGSALERVQGPARAALDAFRP